MRSLVRSLSVVVCLLVSSAVYAQEGGTMLAELARISRDGSVQTTPATLTATMHQTRDVIFTELDIPDAVYEDARTRIVLSVYALVTAKGTWALHGQATFTGIPGGYTDPETSQHNPAPLMETSLKSFLNFASQVRVEISTNRAAEMGVRVFDYDLPVFIPSGWVPTRPTSIISPDERR